MFGNKLCFFRCWTLFSFFHRTPGSVEVNLRPRRGLTCGKTLGVAENCKKTGSLIILSSCNCPTSRLLVVERCHFVRVGCSITYRDIYLACTDMDTTKKNVTDNNYMRDTSQFDAQMGCSLCPIMIAVTCLLYTSDAADDRYVV